MTSVVLALDSKSSLLPRRLAEGLTPSCREGFLVLCTVVLMYTVSYLCRTDEFVDVSNESGTDPTIAHFPGVSKRVDGVHDQRGPSVL